MPQEIRRSGAAAAETELVRHLIARIMFGGGPLTMAEFMSAALTHPTGGFYMRSDVFGSKGHFVTSPEISQLFGEMVGVWSVCLWDQMGQPNNVALVEMGPGRGTLMKDLLLAMGKLRGFASAVRLHLVEVSPALQKMQYETLQCVPTEMPRGATPIDSKGGPNAPSEPSNVARLSATPASVTGANGSTDKEEGKGEAGPSSPKGMPSVPDVATCQLAGMSIPVEWHRSLDTVPQGPAIIIAHEFFDALPVHQFQKTERGWCERLVDLAPPPAEGETPDNRASPFRIVLSNRPTPASQAFVPFRLRAAARAHLTNTAQKEAPPGANKEGPIGASQDGSSGVDASTGSIPSSAVPAHESCTRMEVCPKGIALAQEIAARVGRHGGGALIIDYGSDEIVADSLQAIRDQEFVDLLHEPGAADLSAYVDYGALRSAVEMSGEDATVYGPVPQGPLLLGLGLQARLEVLLELASDEQGIDLIKGCERLVLDMKKGDQLPDGSIAEFEGCVPPLQQRPHPSVRHPPHPAAAHLRKTQVQIQGGCHQARALPRLPPLGRPLPGRHHRPGARQAGPPGPGR
eukprot:jgi/Mesvir1/18010/Mv09343-RA.1